MSTYKHLQNELTSAEVEPGLIASEPEFVDTPGLKHFGLRRAHAYFLWNEEEIDSILIRRKGKKSGKRLWDCASIRAYFARLKSEQAQEAK
jgi:hypothetical protein